jgi:hypothetical protein
MCGASVQCAVCSVQCTVCSVQCAVSVVTCCLVAVFTVRPAQAERRGGCWRLLKNEPWWFSVGSAAPECPPMLDRRSARLFLSSCYYKLEGTKCFLNNFNVRHIPLLAQLCGTVYILLSGT